MDAEDIVMTNADLYDGPAPGREHDFADPHAECYADADAPDQFEVEDDGLAMPPQEEPDDDDQYTYSIIASGEELLAALVYELPEKAVDLARKLHPSERGELVECFVTLATILRALDSPELGKALGVQQPAQPAQPPGCWRHPSWHPGCKECPPPPPGYSSEPPF